MEEPKKPNKHIPLYLNRLCYNNPESIYNTFLELKLSLEKHNQIIINSDDVYIKSTRYDCELVLDKSYPNPNFKTELEKYLLDMEEYLKSL